MKRLFYMAIGALLAAGLFAGVYAAQAATSHHDDPGAPQADQPEKEHRKAPPPLPALAPFLNGLLGHALPGLQGVPQGERFERFLGAQVRFIGENDQPTAASLVPGVVTGFTLAEDGTGSITVRPNGETGAATYAITSDTRILRIGGKQVQEGDKVVLLVVGDKKLTIVYSSSKVELWPGQGGHLRPRPQGPPPGGQAPPPSAAARQFGPQPSARHQHQHEGED